MKLQIGRIWFRLRQYHEAIKFLVEARKEEPRLNAIWVSGPLAASYAYLGQQAKAEIEATRGAIRYWRGDYSSLLADYANATDPRLRENVALRLTVANAAYRAGQREKATPAEMLNSLDQAIGLYERLLQDAGGPTDVAFNYEFLVRLR